MVEDCGCQDQVMRRNIAILTAFLLSNFAVHGYWRDRAKAGAMPPLLESDSKVGAAISGTRIQSRQPVVPEDELAPLSQ